MSQFAITEAGQITDQDQEQRSGLHSPLGDRTGAFSSWYSSKPMRKSKRSFPSRHRLYYKDAPLDSLFRVHHARMGFHAEQTLATQATHVEGLTVWVSTHQLLEWVQLRAENTILRNENERLRSAVGMLAFPPVVRTVALPRPRPTTAPVEPLLDVLGFQLPAHFQSLAGTIEESHSLLQLEDNWDGEGTQGYAEATWRRVVEFLIRHASALWEQHKVLADHIEILPDAAGALAIDWRTDHGELLITFPEDSAKEASYYADDGTGRRKSKGTFDTSILERWLICWLAG